MDRRVGECCVCRVAMYSQQGSLRGSSAIVLLLTAVGE